jgi:hypothetical protein
LTQQPCGGGENVLMAPQVYRMGCHGASRNQFQTNMDPHENFWFAATGDNTASTFTQNNNNEQKGARVLAGHNVWPLLHP